MSVPGSNANNQQSAPPTVSLTGAAGVSDGAASSPRQEPASEETVDFIREWFRPRVEQDPEPETRKDDTEPGNKEQDSRQPKSATDNLPPGARILTQDELDRLVQSETDRREARRRDQERKQAEKDLREKNPYKYAELVAQREAEEEAARTKEQETVQAVYERVSEYDRQVLDTLFLAVPEDEERSKIEQIIGTHPNGPIAGRGEAAKRLVERIRKLGKDEALAEARRTLVNDEAFVKEILARRGGQRVEPDVVSPVGAAQRGAGTADSDMESFIRSGRRGYSR